MPDRRSARELLERLGRIPTIRLSRIPILETYQLKALRAPVSAARTDASLLLADQGAPPTDRGTMRPWPTPQT